MRARMSFVLVGVAAVVAAGVRAEAAVAVPAPGFAVRVFPVPDTVQGGVVRQGNAIIVGQGTFGSGGESIVRLDGSLATTVATGFSSLGGFDNDGSTLYAVDNCFGADFGCGNPTTGDTVYAISDVLARTTAAAASASELLPSGTFPAPQDVLVLPGPVLLVSDARGVGTGRVAKLDGTTLTNFATGLDFLGGLATDGVEVFVANVDGSFSGSVRRYGLGGIPHLPLVSGLSGAFGVARDDAGNVLVTGGFTGDFSSSTLVAFDGAGAPTEWAHGFNFSTDVFFERGRGTALVLDVATVGDPSRRVTAVCADADGDGVCDGDCAGPAAVVKPKLKIGKQATPPGDDTLTFTGEMTIPTAPTLDPVAHGATLLADGADGRVFLDVVVPAGAYVDATKTGWKANDAGTAWTYKNPTGVLGITKVKIKGSAKKPGVFKFQVTGEHGRYDVADVTLPLRAVLALGPAGQGGLTTLPGAETTCRFNSKGTTFTCD
jgi:hypothetical protein